MAASQKIRCECPSFAAAPTQLDPTTNNIWVRTKSGRLRRRLSEPLWATTSCSACSRFCSKACVGSELFRRRCEAQLRMAHPAGGVGDISGQAENDETAYQDGDSQRQARPLPTKREKEGGRGERRQDIKRKLKFVCS